MNGEIRNLRWVVPPRRWCRCGVEFDRFGYHTYICTNKSVCSQARGNVHSELKESLREVSLHYLRHVPMTPMPGEPHVKKYFPPADSTTHSQPPSLDVPDEVYGHAMSIERRADIGFYRHRQAILVDVTTASPLVKVIKHYTPSCAANLDVERKVI